MHRLTPDPQSSLDLILRPRLRITNSVPLPALPTSHPGLAASHKPHEPSGFRQNDIGFPLSDTLRPPGPLATGH